MRRHPRCGDDVDALGLGVAQVWDGRAEDPPAAMVDTSLLNNFVGRWFVGLIQFLHRIRTIESRGTKYSLIL